MRRRTGDVVDAYDLASARSLRYEAEAAGPAQWNVRAPAWCVQPRPNLRA